MRAGNSVRWIGLLLVGGLGVWAGLLWGSRSRVEDPRRAATLAHLVERQEEALDRLERLEAEHAQVNWVQRATDTLPRMAEARQVEPGGSAEPVGSQVPHAPVPAIEEPSAEQLLSAQHAEELLAESIRTGRWTDDDRERFRTYFRGAADAQRAELARQLNLSMMQGKIPFDRANLQL